MTDRKKDAFAAKLRGALQADSNRAILDTALDELGMDSLVSNILKASGVS